MVPLQLISLFTAASALSAASSFSLSPLEIAPGLQGQIGGPVGRPGVIVIQEWWGLTDEVKEHAKRISKAGDYRVFIPDLYRGKIGVDAEEVSW